MIVPTNLHIETVCAAMVMAMEIARAMLGYLRGVSCGWVICWQCTLTCLQRLGRLRRWCGIHPERAIHLSEKSSWPMLPLPLAQCGEEQHMSTRRCTAPQYRKASDPTSAYCRDAPFFVYASCTAIQPLKCTRCAQCVAESASQALRE